MDPVLVAQATTDAVTSAVLAGQDAGEPVDIAKLVYIFCMVSGFLWLVLGAFLGPLLGDIGGHADAFDLQGEVHFSPMSPSVISAFIAAFGCGGLLSMGLFQFTSLESLPLALAAGVVVGGIIYYVVRHVFLNVEGGTEAPGAAVVGVEAEVITTIPEGGLGQISYMAATGRQTASARSEDGSKIPVNTIVEIAQISGTYKIVRRKPAPEPEKPAAEASGQDEGGNTSG